MSVAVIADAHIDGPGGEPGPLIEQLRQLGEGGCRRLILLGDLFQTWIGQRRYETAAIRAGGGGARRAASAAACGSTTSRATATSSSVRGRTPSCSTASATRWRWRSAAAACSWCTATGSTAKDRLYRFWRWFSHCPPVRLAMFHLPRRLAQRLVVGFERGLARTNFKHKTEIPEEPILELRPAALRRRPRRAPARPLPRAPPLAPARGRRLVAGRLVQQPPGGVARRRAVHGLGAGVTLSGRPD